MNEEGQWFCNHCLRVTELHEALPFNACAICCQPLLPKDFHETAKRIPPADAAEKFNQLRRAIDREDSPR